MSLRRPRAALLLCVLGLFVLVLGCASAPGSRGPEWEAFAERTTNEGRLHLHCAPEQADVRLDGVSQGKCSDYASRPLALSSGRGLQRLEVTLAGFWDYRTQLQADGTVLTLRTALVPRAKANPEKSQETEAVPPVP